MERTNEVHKYEFQIHITHVSDGLRVFAAFDICVLAAFCVRLWSNCAAAAATMWLPRLQPKLGGGRSSVGSAQK